LIWIIAVSAKMINLVGDLLRMKMPMHRLYLMLVCGGLFAGMAGCAPEVSKNGVVLYRDNCVICHGVTGAGDGPLAADLPVPPANLRQLAAGNGNMFPAERVMTTIYGYRGKETLALMPEFGPVLEGSTVIWTAPDGSEIETPAELIALAEYLETLQDR
jgi:mono/diheme cytochrome c family protein